MPNPSHEDAFGPGLLIVGLAALVIQLAVMRRTSRVTAGLALAGIVLIAVESAAGGAVRLLVMPAGAGCLWLALNALSRASMHAQAVLAVDAGRLAVHTGTMTAGSGDHRSGHRRAPLTSSPLDQASRISKAID